MRTNFPSVPRVLAAGAAVLLSAGSAKAVTITTVGTYDPAAQANQVDFNASGNLLSSTAATDVGGFTANVASAFAGNQGGVVNFDFAANTTFSVIDAVYGLNGNKNLNITASKVLRATTTTSGTPISGTRIVLPDADLASDAYTLTFGNITNTPGGAVVPGEFVSQVGLTVLSRNTGAFPSNVTLTAGFSGGGTASQTALIDRAQGTDDTFYGFVAPAGQSISTLSVALANTTGDARALVDDLGFITAVVPEPASATAVLAGLAGLTLRRRRGAGC